MPTTITAHGARTRRDHLIAIMASGGFAGGGLLIGVAAGRRWLEMDPMVWQQGFWAEFLGFAVAIVPLFLLTFVGLYRSRRADIDVPAARWWWTAGLVMWGINCVITSAYYLPVNIQLSGVPFSPEEAEAVRTLWLALHAPRVLLAIGTFLAAAQGALISAAASGSASVASPSDR